MFVLKMCENKLLTTEQFLRHNYVEIVQAFVSSQPFTGCESYHILSEIKEKRLQWRVRTIAQLKLQK